MATVDFLSRQRRGIASFALLLAASMPASAAPQPVCAMLDALVALLETDHGERHITSGENFDGRDARIYMSDTGTWMLLVIHANGIACIMAVGEALPLNGLPS